MFKNALKLSLKWGSFLYHGELICLEDMHYFAETSAHDLVLATARQ